MSDPKFGDPNKAMRDADPKPPVPEWVETLVDEFFHEVDTQLVKEIVRENVLDFLAAVLREANPYTKKFAQYDTLNELLRWAAAQGGDDGK